MRLWTFIFRVNVSQILLKQTLVFDQTDQERGGSANLISIHFAYNLTFTTQKFNIFLMQKKKSGPKNPKTLNQVKKP